MEDGVEESTGSEDSSSPSVNEDDNAVENEPSDSQESADTEEVEPSTVEGEGEVVPASEDSEPADNGWGAPSDESTDSEIPDNGQFSEGGTEDPMELYRSFKGEDPDISALLEDRGLN